MSAAVASTARVGARRAGGADETTWILSTQEQGDCTDLLRRAGGVDGWRRRKFSRRRRDAQGGRNLGRPDLVRVPAEQWVRLRSSSPFRAHRSAGRLRCGHPCGILGGPHGNPRRFPPVGEGCNNRRRHPANSRHRHESNCAAVDRREPIYGGRSTPRHSHDGPTAGRTPVRHATREQRVRYIARPGGHDGASKCESSSTLE